MHFKQPSSSVAGTVTLQLIRQQTRHSRDSAVAMQNQYDGLMVTFSQISAHYGVKGNNGANELVLMWCFSAQALTHFVQHVPFTNIHANTFFYI